MDSCRSCNWSSAWFTKTKRRKGFRIENKNG
jgi:hypothetical protein